MAEVSLAQLLVQETKAAIYKAALSIASGLGLPVSSWQPGDPTRSLYWIESELHEVLEAVASGYAASGFLDFAKGLWLKLLAKQVFNVDVPDATFASTDVTLTNTGGGLYTIEPGELILKNSATGKTYRNTSGGTIEPLAQAPANVLVISVEAEEAGSASSAAAGEIDDLVTVLNGVECTNSTAAIGIDEQDESVTKQQCRDKLGSLSPNGPREAYSYVARNSKLTGTSVVTKVRVYPNTVNGQVEVYLAGPSGGILEPDRVKVNNALQTWATPISSTTLTYSANNVIVDITYTAWIYRSVNKTGAEIQDEVETQLQQMFADQPIGGNSSSLHVELIRSTIQKAHQKQTFNVQVATPALDVPLMPNQVAILGTVTATINLVNDP